ncbi:uroporphyrinogen decarboxylase family protein [Tichowtungia aerotolerans]|uniref:Uroporphyrinogen decarboxylase (URO-D) domain-containing protein n=1 Tax=Tichowtungia aerotolerans TaxID=2697043 RepID=A0A6P1M8D9_9BACT|nr:uroporphyrinogen decarboxylase family protein [Tichowtungia aerotolerans]QHI70157.1 hypothetical protein GT409_12110 [Tichowtungia aerotolerans]
MNLRQIELDAIAHKNGPVPADAIVLENTSEMAAYLGVREDRVYELLGICGRLIEPQWKPVLRGEKPRGMNAFGTFENDQHAGRENPLDGCETIEAIEALNWPDPYDFNFEMMRPMIDSYHGEVAMRGPGWRPLFFKIADLWGMEEALVNMLSEPELFEVAVERVFEFSYRHAERYMETVGDSVDVFYCCDDFATQRGLMFSPEQWRKWFKPYYAKLFAIGKKYNRPVWFHSCGDITPVLPDMIEIGMDVWETVQLHALPFGMEKLKSEYGRDLCFFGGISTQKLPFMTPNEVHEITARTIDVMAKDGGYICGGDHHIQKEVPPENVLALFETVREFQ